LGNRDLFGDFATWLGEQRQNGWLTSISSGTLDPFKGAFARFMADKGFPMPSDEKIDHEFKRLTESEMEKEARQKKEREERERAAAEEERKKREREALRQWAYKHIKDTLKDLGEDEIEGLHVSDLVTELEQQHPKKWREVFLRLLKAAEQKHQEGQGRRGSEYRYLLRIEGKLWNEVVQN
jgi:hypothetical protein